ncbi:MAG: 3-isopropylmalate dehydratase small subunit [Rhizobacter sp.]
MNDSPRGIVAGPAAAIDIANLDTDQIMPKQFLRGIDKAGLDRGLLWDLRFDGDGRPRPDFVLNRPAWAGTRVLVGGPNFGCGSSREHAVWGLQQYGVQAVIAPGFGEIFYSNALNNGLLVASVSPEDGLALLHEADTHEPLRIEVDATTMTVRTPTRSVPFTLSDRHRRMVLDGLDLIGASLAYRDRIEAFASRHHAEQPWATDVARRTRERLGRT